MLACRRQAPCPAGSVLEGGACVAVTPVADAARTGTARDAGAVAPTVILSKDEDRYSLPDGQQGLVLHYCKSLFVLAVPATGGPPSRDEDAHGRLVRAIDEGD